ncbi:MAG: hypothetical protein A3E83_05445 [Gammaproteobacteria bacterium RIFCSPHIGHO2_12_FULL_41_20]|nr:MAG: hypothetical protein A3E83_05445 [Gammaproteobacteria bacterium RIFCSPHIGHO2_12_FULL_41_20]
MDSLRNAALAGGLEASLFLPLDTARVRLQLFQGRSNATNLMGHFRGAMSVILGTPSRPASLYQGLIPAVGYRMLQRTIQFGAQPLTKVVLENHLGNPLKEQYGDNAAAIMLNGTAGSIVGSVEAALLPVEKIKLFQQQYRVTIAIAARAVMHTPNPWQGVGITMGRNAPGAFVLFAVSDLIKRKVFHADQEHPLSVAQHVAASVSASATSVVVTAPIDVVRTRTIAQKSENRVGALSIFRRTLQEEGASAFAKGLGPRLMSVVPKLGFTMTMVSLLGSIS